MRVLITGAAGRVGSRSVDSFIGAGHNVVGFDVQDAPPARDRCNWHAGRLESPADVEAAVQGVEIVIHLGAVMSWSRIDQDLMHRVNVDGTRILLDKSAEAGVRRFVFASSGEVYPENAPEFLPITEEHPLKPNSFYGLTKLLGEELVRFHQRAGSMETVILRFAHTQDSEELLDEDSFFSGPRFFLKPRIQREVELGNLAMANMLRSRDPGPPCLLLLRSREGRPFMMHITETRDMASGLLIAAEHPSAAGGTFNLGATEPVEFGPLLERMSALTGYPVVEVEMDGPGVHYRTSNALIRNRLGFNPKWSIEDMMEEAAQARRVRSLG